MKILHTLLTKHKKMPLILAGICAIILGAALFVYQAQAKETARQKAVIQEKRTKETGGKETRRYESEGAKKIGRTKKA
jgi:flagellar biosynthesis/type III secretory pathway M-ring protein FliF/YscJ